MSRPVERYQRQTIRSSHRVELRRENVSGHDDDEREDHRERHVAGDRDGRRGVPEQRAVRLLARDVNRKERDDEGGHPSAIGTRPHLLLEGDLREQMGGFRMIG